MKRNTSLFVLLIASLLHNVVGANEEDRKMSDNVNVLEAVTTMTEAFHDKDIKGVLASYEEGAAIMFESGKRVSGEEAIQRQFEGAFQINPKFEYPNGHEAYIAGEIALHIAPWTMTAKAPDGTDIQDSGLSVAVLRKQASGKWLLVLDNPHGQRLLEK